MLRPGEILLVQHREPERLYWTLHGGGVEAGETPQQAVVREVREETGLSSTVERLLFSELYAHGICECYLLRVHEIKEVELGVDPEEADLPARQKTLRDVAWHKIASVREDRQVAQVLKALKEEDER